MFENSNDGVTFTPIVTLPTFGLVQHTMAFASVTARYFRLRFLDKVAAAPQLGDIDLSESGGKPASGPLATLLDLYSTATPGVAASSAIAAADVIDLSVKMQKDGTLDWTPPAGRWAVLRMGYSLTGITNHPAPPEATGPEVDKLNKGYVKAYLDRYLDNYKDASGGMMGLRGLRYVITDSWEAGTQNWTDDMVAEFTKRRGYDPRPWMPVLTGRVVGSAADSDVSFGTFAAPSPTCCATTTTPPSPRNCTRAALASMASRTRPVALPSATAWR